MTTPLVTTRVLWRPEQYNRVSNPGFETNTTGWSVSAGINAAGTSVTRITTDAHEGSACASVVCTATDESGVNWDFGSDRFYSWPTYGARYRATVWLRRTSGSKRARLTLGSEGTSSDRATLTITDLSDQWQPYSVLWLPSANRTDVQLAVTNGSAQALTVKVDTVSVWQVDAFSQCENGTFETDTTGWSVLNLATGTRITTDAWGGSASMRVVTSAGSSTSGVGYDLGDRAFVSGRTYRLRFAAKSEVGSTAIEAVVGEVGTDSTTTGITLTTGWAWYVADWTPSADRTTAEVRIRNTTAASRTFLIDEVEVYEALDDLGSDAGDTTWSRSLTSGGTLTTRVVNDTGKYDPRDTSGVLYGSLSPGRRIWTRATYDGALHPLFWGTLRTIEPDPFTAKADLIADDAMADLDRAVVSYDFDSETDYRGSRVDALEAWASEDPQTRNDQPGVPPQGELLTDGGIEGNTFYIGTDSDLSVLEVLDDLNEATGSVHFVKASVHANIGWYYVTVDRATLTDDSSDWTVDDDFEALTGVRLTHEALENRQTISWQAYELFIITGAAEDGYGYVAVALDPAVYGSDGTGEEPYLTYADEQLGSDDGHPEPRWRYPRRGGETLSRKEFRRRNRRRRRMGAKLLRRTRIYPDALVPFTMEAGDVRTFVVDFAIPIDAGTVTIDGDVGDVIVDILEDRTTRQVFTLSAIGDATIDFFGVAGIPWLPLDDIEETVHEHESQALYGIHPGPVISSPYIPAKGDAQGLGAYRNWRYGEPRLRPRLTLGRGQMATALGVQVADHITLSADRWRIDALPFLVTDVTWRASKGGLEWHVDIDLEELPAHDPWFVLDTSATSTPVPDGSELDDTGFVLAY